jgi:hypothetical protein
MKHLHAFIGAALAVAVMVLVGCASTPDGQRGERLMVQGSVVALIERAADPAQKAQRIALAIKASRTLLLDDTVTVGGLRNALLTRAAGLSPGEKLVALEVITALSNDVERRVGSGVLSPDARVSVNTVLDWVNDVTILYVPHQPDT